LSSARTRKLIHINPNHCRAFSFGVHKEVKDEMLKENTLKPKHREMSDAIENWSRKSFYAVGTFGIGGVLASFGLYGGSFSVILAVPVGLYWYQGLKDMNQRSSSVLYNFPVLGHFRYLLEGIGPEIRQYFVESDNQATPFSREQRAMVYSRSKLQRDTLPFGTRRDVYVEGYEWINHSIYPCHVPDEHRRVLVGGPQCKKPYLASRYNISAMSYGALSQNAVKALNKAAKMGGFWHNTGEGGISPHHQQGGDLVWNIGTGYFGCRCPETGGFSAERFVETIKANSSVKMVEIKLSQGAKPAHGGMLPGAKVTKEISEIRGIPEGVDCDSPPNHAAFSGPRTLLKFVQTLRDLSDGLPIGFKLCIGRPEEFSAIVAAMKETDIYPDFITVDGAEGGTGAAPPEFSNHVGFPLTDALHFVQNTLVGAGVRDKIKVVCSGKVLSGFSMVRNLSLGADICVSARAFMFSMGCIQALKCDTGRCPTGVTSQDPELMKGLDPAVKFHRVYNFHHKTLEQAFHLIGAMGVSDPDLLHPGLVMRRTSGGTHAKSYADMYPPVDSNYLSRMTSRKDTITTGSLVESSWRKGKQLLQSRPN